MDIIQKDIISFFNDTLKDIKCQDDTKAYIVSIFVKYKSTDFDLSKDNATLLFAQARLKQDFSLYQNIGDWLLFAGSWAPQHLRFASQDYYDTIASASYYSCYNLINRKWSLFKDLSDNFVSLETQIKNSLNKVIV